MKKIITTLTIIFSIFILTGCGPKTYDEITYNKLEKMINEKQDFILFIGSETCSACSSFKFTVNELVKNHKIDIKYIDISKLSDTEKDKLLEHFPFDATPTTVLVKKGKEKGDDNRIVGNQKYSKVEKTLKEKGYIK
ncbi:MAG: thioredoxin family protein [Bacilli bacterium]|nr:thioredoxin family protein [Bacilli bacterium]